PGGDHAGSRETPTTTRAAASTQRGPRSLHASSDERFGLEHQAPAGLKLCQAPLDLPTHPLPLVRSQPQIELAEPSAACLDSLPLPAECLEREAASFWRDGDLDEARSREQRVESTGVREGRRLVERLAVIRQLRAQRIGEDPEEWHAVRPRPHLEGEAPAG